MKITLKTSMGPMDLETENPNKAFNLLMELPSSFQATLSKSEPKRSAQVDLTEHRQELEALYGFLDLFLLTQGRKEALPPAPKKPFIHRPCREGSLKARVLDILREKPKTPLIHLAQLLYGSDDKKATMKLSVILTALKRQKLINNPTSGGWVVTQG